MTPDVQQALGRAGLPTTLATYQDAQRLIRTIRTLWTGCFAKRRRLPHPPSHMDRVLT
jgi:hypothetical protein